jgi:DNA-binding NarL/FixJ family response regulator
LIVDDQLLFAEALSITLRAMGLTVIGIHATGGEGLTAALHLEPDLLLVDPVLPDRDGLLVGAAVLAALPATKVVALTALEDERVVQEAIRLGFHGYLTKHTAAEQFKRFLASVLDDQVVFPHRLGGHAPAADARDDYDLLIDQLTPREREVLQLLAEGASGLRIASSLGVSPNTVRTHVHGILSKLQVHSRLEAVAFAVRHELVSTEQLAATAGAGSRST